MYLNLCKICSGRLSLQVSFFSKKSRHFVFRFALPISCLVCTHSSYFVLKRKLWHVKSTVFFLFLAIILSLFTDFTDPPCTLYSILVNSTVSLGLSFHSVYCTFYILSLFIIIYQPLFTVNDYSYFSCTTSIDSSTL